MITTYPLYITSSISKTNIVKKKMLEKDKDEC